MSTLCRGCGEPLRLPYEPATAGKLHHTSLHCVDCWADADTRSKHETRLLRARARRQGRPVAVPRRRHVPLETVMQEWEHLRVDYTPAEVAERLGMAYGTFARAITRAAQAGDPRAGQFPGKHGLMDPSRRIRQSSYRRAS